jgi:hypothetical protein
MEKRFLKDMTQNELKMVFENGHISELACTRLEENEMYWIGEKLQGFTSLMNWSIGFNNHNFIKVKDDRLFIREMLDFVNDYGLMIDEENTVRLLNQKLDEITLLEDTIENEEDFEETIETFSKTLQSILIEHFNVSTWYAMNDAIDYFISDIEGNPDTYDYYILENNFSVVYEDIPAITKTYK